MSFDQKLKQFEIEGKKLVKEKQIRDLVFSDNIYEVNVFDPYLKTDFWPFIQIDDQKNILDAFCDCQIYEKRNFCPHITAAFFYIVKKNEPVHIRFKKSFFNALFKIISFQIGFDKEILKKRTEGNYYFSKGDKELFSIEANQEDIKKLETILEKKEEQSIKYLGISFEEINLYKEGKASKELKYELSVFSDMAKWLFLKQNNDQHYQIKFLDKKEGIYSKIIIAFENVKVKFEISFNEWEEIIPTLNTVESSLSLYEYQGKKINKILYDREKKSFLVEKTKGILVEDLSKQKGITIGNYIYVEDRGFYPVNPTELLQVDVIEKDKVSYFLSKYKDIFLQKVENEKIHPKSISANYFLFFDDRNNLHVKLYLFDKTDFEKKFSYFFNPWAFLEDKGFYFLENLYFPFSETIIKEKDVSEFINRQRSWLHNFKGFQTHFGSIQSHLVYSLNDNEDLVFNSKLDFPEEFGSFIDFNEWIYIKGIGFFSKKEKKLGLPIRPGLILKKEEISKFIDNHIEELELIENFFTDINPVQKIGFNIYLNDDLNVVIKPEIILKKGYEKNQIHFFDNYAYLEKKGFFRISEIPKRFQRYEKEKVLSKEQEAFFVTFELQRLKPYIIELDKRLVKPKQLVFKIVNIKKRTRKSKTFWMIDMIYQSEIGKVHLIDIYKAINEGKNYFFSPAGLIFLKEPRFNWLKSVKKQKLTKNKSYLSLSSLDIIRIFLLEDIKFSKYQTKENLITRKILQELNTFETDKFFDISNLNASLRPYQEIGIKWLWFLYVNNLSGLLCDDMGLGKTHQAMALIAAIQKEDHYKYIVVCPTSVIYHWQELLKTFLPTIKPYIYYGLDRNIQNFSEKYDLLLTSYGIVRSDRDLLKKFKFELAIFDEIQIAKNANSVTHKSLRKINASMRLGLTGTPIENYLSELKALFDLVIPTYLPTEAAFKETFVNPIEKENNIERQKLLKKLIKPFILRRQKKDVLFDLPEKIEEIAFADLSDQQRQMYNDVVLQTKEKILPDLQNKAKPISYIHIFAILTKLKRICDHPSLILKDIDDYEKHQSGKFELFIELLDEAQASQQKVVVFSQYLDMITIIKKYLKKKSIGFASIVGATKKRFAEIKKFKEDPRCLVFVASLLAAGIGIDLTAGSVVIHFDRWWNPAKENQATDRVHRIGQNRGVQVFKLVTKNTIEERIHGIIERKKSLIEQTIGVDEVDQVKTLSREELIEVFKMIEG